MTPARGEATDDQSSLEAGVERRHDHAVPEHGEPADQRQREQDGRHRQRAQLEGGVPPQAERGCKPDERRRRRRRARPTERSDTASLSA